MLYRAEMLLEHTSSHNNWLIKFTKSWRFCGHLALQLRPSQRRPTVLSGECLITFTCQMLARSSDHGHNLK